MTGIRTQIGRGVLVVVVIAGGVVPRAVAAEEGDVVASAKATAFAGKRSEAVSALRDHLRQAANDDEARLLLGTILSWDGAYSEARKELEAVLVRSPRDTDAISALINVELWADHPSRAVQLAQMGARLKPGDARFVQALRKAKRAVNEMRAWQVGASTGGDWFSDGREPWRESQVSLGGKTPAGSFSLNAARAERFGSRDDQVEVEVYPRIHPGTYAYVAGAIAPQHALYPRHRFAADLNQSLGGGFEGSVGVRRLTFGSTTTLYVGALSKYVGDWLVGGRMFYVPDATGASSRSYHASVRRYSSSGASYVGMRYAYGMSREEIRDANDFALLGSRTIAADATLALGSRLSLHVSGSTARQERADREPLLQHSLSGSLGLRF